MTMLSPRFNPGLAGCFCFLLLLAVSGPALAQREPGASEGVRPAAESAAARRSPQAADLLSKLRKLKLDLVGYQQERLPQALSELSQRANEIDPEGKGFDFVLAEWQPPAEGFPKGEYIFPPDKVPQLTNVTVSVGPPLLRNLSLEDCLLVLTHCASYPLDWSVASNVVVASVKSPALSLLHIRTYPAEERAVRGAVQALVRKPINAAWWARNVDYLPAEVNTNELADLVPYLFSCAGIETSPPRSVVFDAARSTVTVKATEPEQRAIDSLFKLIKKPTGP
jgi:hypothetical protein